MTRLRGAALALLCFALVGCGSTSSPHAAPSPASSTTATSASPSAGPTSDAVPAGMRRLTAKTSGVSIGIPRSWTVIDAARFDDPKYRPFFLRYAASHHLSLDQFHAMVRQIDLMAVAPALTAVDQINVNVELVPLVAEIPTPESLRAQFRAINAHIIAISDVETPVGTGREVSFDIGSVGTIGGTVHAYGIGIFVRVNNGIAGVTVSAGTLAHARASLARILPTLRDRGTSTANKA